MLPESYDNDGTQVGGTTRGSVSQASEVAETGHFGRGVHTASSVAL